MKENIKKVLAITSFMFLLSGCGTTTTKSSEHVHTFASDWTTNESQHWHVCTGENCAQVSGKGDHTFGEFVVTEEPTEEKEGKKVRTCSVCNYQDEVKIDKLKHQHTADTSHWEKDATGHWHKATCEHKDEKIDFANHTWGEYTVIKEETYNTPGSKKHTCTVCNYEEIVEVPATNEGPEQGFTNLAVAANLDSTFATGENVDTKYGPGVKLTATKNAGTDERVFSIVLDKVYDTAKSMAASGAQVSFYLGFAGATKYDSKNKPFSYQFVKTNTSEANRAISAPSDVAPLAVTKDATGKWIKVTIQLSACSLVANGSESFDRLNFRVKNSYFTWNQNDTILLASMYAKNMVEFVEKAHNFSTEWTSDDEYHWHACLDDGCTTVDGKEKHNFVSDPDNPDVKPTTTNEGEQHLKCDVCGKTKTVTIPKESTDGTKAVSMGWTNNDSEAADNVSLVEGSGESAGFMVGTYDKLTASKQPAAQYNVPSDIDLSKYDTMKFQIKNLHADHQFYTKLYLLDSDKVNVTKEGTIESQLGTSTISNDANSDGSIKSLKIKVKAGDLVTITVKLGGKDLHRAYIQMNEAIDSAGTFWISRDVILSNSNGGQEETKTIELEPGWTNNDSEAADNVVLTNGTGDQADYIVGTFDKLTSGKQPIAKYGVSSSFVDTKQYGKMSFELKNRHDSKQIYFRFYMQNADKISMLKGVSIENASTSQAYTENDATTGEVKYIKIKAQPNELIKITVEFSDAAINRMYFQTNETLDSAGSFLISKKVTFIQREGVTPAPETNNTGNLMKLANLSKKDADVTFTEVTDSAYGDGIKITFNADAAQSCKFAVLNLGQDIPLQKNMDSAVKAVYVDGISTWTDSYKITTSGLRYDIRDSSDARVLKTSSNFKGFTSLATNVYQLNGKFSDIGVDSGKVLDETTTIRKITFVVRPGAKAGDTLTIYNLNIDLAK